MERRAAQWVYDLPGWLTQVFDLAMQAGTRGAIVLAVLAALVARRWRVGLQLALAGTSAWLAAWVLKRVADRPRPTARSLGRPLRDVVEGPGLPSTHAAIAAALATVVVRSGVGGRPLAAGAVILAALTAVARVHLGVHWPLDVLVGAAIGVVAGLAVTQPGRGGRAGVVGDADGPDERAGRAGRAAPEHS
jgi:undecaprenyl-diphosphatase